MDSQPPAQVSPGFIQHRSIMPGGQSTRTIIPQHLHPADTHQSVMPQTMPVPNPTTIITLPATTSPDTQHHFLVNPMAATVQPAIVDAVCGNVAYVIETVSTDHPVLETNMQVANTCEVSSVNLKDSHMTSHSSHKDTETSDKDEHQQPYSFLDTGSEDYKLWCRVRDKAGFNDDVPFLHWLLKLAEIKLE